jgi:hypothetical protein
MKDYLNKYGSKQVGKFQMGGEMAPEAQAAPAPQGGNDLQAMLAQYAQTRDPQLAVAICDALIAELGAAQGGAPEGGQPMPAARNGGRLSYAAPMFKKGGRL